MKRLMNLLFGLIFPRINLLLSIFSKKRPKEAAGTEILPMQEVMATRKGRAKPTSRSDDRVVSEPSKSVWRARSGRNDTFIAKVMKIAKTGRSDAHSGARADGKAEIERAFQIEVKKLNQEYEVEENRLLRIIAKKKCDLEDDSHELLVEALNDSKVARQLEEFEQGGVVKVGKKGASSIAEERSKIETIQTNAMEEGERLDFAYDELINGNYEGKVPEKKWIDKDIPFNIAVWAAILVEWYANFDAFQGVEGFIKNNLLAMVIALVAAWGQAYGAKGFGAALSQNEKEKMKSFFWLTLGVCGFICYFRFDMEFGLAASFASMFVNVMLAVLTVFLAYFHERHNAIFTCIANREKNTATLNHCQMELERLDKLEESLKSRVLVDSEAAKLQQKNDRKRLLEDRIEQLHLELDSLKIEKMAAIAELEQVRDEAMAQYERDFKRAAKIAKHEGNGVNGTGKQVGSSLLSLLLLACLSLASCSNDLPSTHIEVVLDVTGKEHCFSAEEVEMAVIEELKLEELASWGDVVVNVSTISHVTETAVKKVKLERSGFFLTRNETAHERKKERFRKELNQAIESAALSRKEKQHSYVHRNLAARMNALQKKDGEKWVMVWSDLLQHRSGLSFYHYRHNPKLMIRDLDELIAKMEEDSPLQKMEGVKLLNYYLPEKHTDELNLKAKKLFSEYWKSKGLEIEFRSRNLVQRDLKQAGGIRKAET